MALKKGQDIELDIDDAAYKGKGIGKIDGLAVFVPNTTPGDRIKARILKKKKSYAEAKLLEVLEKGPYRIDPKCQHAKNCGGCSWQHVSYEHQKEFKRDQVRDHIHRIGGLTDLEVNPIIGCDLPFYYRNKMEYSIGHKRWLSQEEVNRDEYVDDRCFAVGLHAPGRFDKILNINECHLQDPISYKIMDFFRQWCVENNIAPFNRIDHKGFMRNLIIRKAYYTDDLMVNIVTYQDDQGLIEPLAEALLKEFPEITTIINNVNDTKSPTSEGRYEKIIHGPGYITDKIGDYRFNIDANAFFQTNTPQAEQLYKIVKDFAGIRDNDIIYDLYCGVGTLTIYLSDKAKKVVGIELEEVAIRNAQKNAEKNNIDNVSFVKGDMKDVFTEEISDRYGDPNCLVTDPPRAGMHPDVVERLIELKVPKIVYVSCNSSTMARDLKKLNEVYEIQDIQPVDMFPQTYHIETVAKLRLRT
ncbi:23S rRNA (uracil(1939)-C(5))-methyltransferase RlmD [Fodinibius halophilus]|uniref:23S rRNA (Uracil(1939)-C(5))-methyltransferase RlmD n=1 Tax=Fodinibius halophilus TaxID=1736908 RepID=A0A6M1SVH7_9BACT|nr:23S rRNA (uracil(1939)-C(5))-methyltransferase RlmD [Fodinibius halophilus]NGP87938.1 23S rRNA (uracil(1939)-C(5))-methyltransferase RlmD [Fodinibius halophilus]